MQDHAPQAALDDIADDAWFTVSRCDEAPGAAQLAGTLAKLVDQCDAADTHHKKKLRRAKTKADPKAVAARGGVEAFANTTSKKLLGIVNQDRSDVRFAKYMTKPASELTDLDRDGLRAWLSAVVDVATAEADKAIAAILKPAAGLRDNWDAAETGRDSAEAAIAHHRTTVKEPLVATVNAERRILLGALVQLAAKNKLGKKWPQTFFRKAAKARKVASDTPNP